MAKRVYCIEIYDDRLLNISRYIVARDVEEAAAKAARALRFHWSYQMETWPYPALRTRGATIENPDGRWAKIIPC